MTRPISIEHLTRLAQLASRISIMAPIKPRDYQIQVYVPTRIVREIRETLTAAGINWEKDSKQFRRRMRELRAERKATESSIRADLKGKANAT